MTSECDVLNCYRDAFPVHLIFQSASKIFSKSKNILIFLHGVDALRNFYDGLSK